MPDQITPDSTVSYSVKELLAEQTDLLREIDRKVDTKADKADISDLHRRIDSQEGRLKTLEDERDGDRLLKGARASARRHWWMATTAVLVPIGTALILVFVH